VRTALTSTAAFGDVSERAVAHTLTSATSSLFRGEHSRTWVDRIVLFAAQL